jgi:Immunoglobulin-like domain of bacterial spore germination
MKRFILIVTAALLQSCSEPSSAPATVAQTPANADVSAPAPGTRVTSPLRVTGTAPNSWYFEAVLPATLVGPNGAVIAEAPAQAQSDWTVEGPVGFVAEFTFSVQKDTPATIILEREVHEDDNAHVDQLRVPVILTAP